MVTSRSPAVGVQTSIDAAVEACCLSLDREMGPVEIALVILINPHPFVHLSPQCIQPELPSDTERSLCRSKNCEPTGM